MQKKILWINAQFSLKFLSQKTLMWAEQYSLKFYMKFRLFISNMKQCSIVIIKWNECSHQSVISSWSAVLFSMLSPCKWIDGRYLLFITLCVMQWGPPRRWLHNLFWWGAFFSVLRLYGTAQSILLWFIIYLHCSLIMYMFSLSLC